MIFGENILGASFTKNYFMKQLDIKNKLTIQKC